MKRHACAASAPSAVPTFNPLDWIAVAGDQLVTTSLLVAKAFRKRHGDVLRAAVLADELGELTARNPRHANVEQKDVRLMLENPLRGAHGSCARRHSVAGAQQPLRHHRDDDGVVIHDQDVERVCPGLGD